MATRDFSMFAGDDLTLTVTVKETDGTATTITSAAISWKASKSNSKTAAITKSTAAGGVTITNGAGGIFTVSLDPADTTSLEGDYIHEAQITFSNGDVRTVLRGVMTIEPELI